MYLHIYILLVRERFLGHYQDRSWSTSSDEGSQEKWTSGGCRSGYRGSCGESDRCGFRLVMDNERLGEVVRAPHVRARPPDCPIGNGSWIMTEYG